MVSIRAYQIGKDNNVESFICLFQVIAIIFQVDK